jgi:preprotein translocase subunit SecF
MARNSIASRIYRGDISYDFVAKRRRWYALSLIVILLALGGLAGRGLNLGLEFKGGSEFLIPAQVTQAEGRQVAAEAGLTDVIVTVVGGDKLRIQTGDLSTQEQERIADVLAASLGVNVSEIQTQLVGPTWGGQITKKALQSLVVFLILVTIVLALYFEWQMAAAAIIALAHDVFITVGIYALTGFEVTPATVIGVLTILGFSLYDTVVVFDKVRENTRAVMGGNRMTYSEAANIGLNQSVVRSINTSIVALLPVAAILFVGVGLLGAGTLRDLALALFIGTIAGTYSSIFIATPVLTQLKARDPEVQALDKRVSARRASGKPAEGSSRVAVAERDEDRDHEAFLDRSALSVKPAGPRRQPRRNTPRSKR